MAVPLFGELADQMPRLSPLCGLELGLRATGQRELKCVVEGLAEVLIPRAKPSGDTTTSLTRSTGYSYEMMMIFVYFFCLMISFDYV